MDLDGDGRQDMVSGCYPGQIYFFKRKPNGAFASSVILKHKSSKPINVGMAAAVAVADWNGDAKLDLLIGNIDGAVFLVPNEGTPPAPAFGAPQQLRAGGSAIKANGGDAGPCVADWDGDGDLDLLIGHGNGDVTWHANTGSKTEPRLGPAVSLIKGPSNSAMTAKEFDSPKAPGRRTKVCVADWNGDGRSDLLVGDFSAFRTDGGQSRYHGWVWVYLRAVQTASR